MTIKEADVAILMATYNGADWIEPQISSIRSQLKCSYHLYVRDDGSTDQTIDIIKNESKNDLNIILMDSFGFSTGGASSNFFLMLSNIDEKKYKYISFSDQDDIWFPEKIVTAVDYMIANGADAYSSNLIAYDNNSIKAWVLDKCVESCKFDYIFQGASAGCTYVLASHTVSKIKSVMVDFLRAYPSEFSHDWIIYAICRSHGLKWIHDSRSFIAYRQHQNNVFGAKPGFLGLFSKFLLIKNGWYRKHILFLKKFIIGTPDELRLIDAVERMSIGDRFFLVSNVFSFRRNKWDSIKLAFLFALGGVGK
jgi:rhamnosyltransferase